MSRRVLHLVLAGAGALGVNAACISDDPGAATLEREAGAEAAAPPSDGGGDAPSPVGFCAGHRGALLCEDFDEGSLTEHGWSQRVDNGGVELVVSERSAPWALRAVTRNTSGPPARASIERTVTLPASFSKLRLSADLGFPTRAAPGAPAEGFALYVGETFALTLRDEGAPSETVRDLGVFATSAQDPSALVAATATMTHPSGWARYEIELTRDGNVTSVVATRERAPFPLPEGPTPILFLPSGELRIEIGAWVSGDSGEVAHDLDNVLLTVE